MQQTYCTFNHNSKPPQCMRCKSPIPYNMQKNHYHVHLLSITQAFGEVSESDGDLLYDYYELVDPETQLLCAQCTFKAITLVKQFIAS